MTIDSGDSNNAAGGTMAITSGSSTAGGVGVLLPLHQGVLQAILWVVNFPYPLVKEVLLVENKTCCWYW